MDYNFVFAVLTLLLLVLFEEVITISKIVLFDVTQLVSSIKFQTRHAWANLSKYLQLHTVKSLLVDCVVLRLWLVGCFGSNFLFLLVYSLTLSTENAFGLIARIRIKFTYETYHYFTCSLHWHAAMVGRWSLQGLEYLSNSSYKFTNVNFVQC